MVLKLIQGDTYNGVMYALNVLSVLIRKTYLAKQVRVVLFGRFSLLFNPLSDAVPTPCSQLKGIIPLDCLFSAG